MNDNDYNDNDNNDDDNNDDDYNDDDNARYHRAEFSLMLEETSRSPSCQPEPVYISPYSKWEEVAKLFNPAERPVVLNRASSTNTTNPFGSTFCYGYQDIIFEVMPNGHVASLTLYLPPGLTPYKEGEEGRGELLPL